MNDSDRIKAQQEYQQHSSALRQLADAIDATTEAFATPIQCGLVLPLERRELLLQKIAKLGFGRNTQVGTRYRQVTQDTTAAQFFAWLQEDDNYIFVTEGLDLTLQYPLDTGAIIQGRNTTFDGEGGRLKIQMGVRNSSSTSANTDYPQQSIWLQKGHGTIHRLKLIGDLTKTIEAETPSFNGHTDGITILGGDHYAVFNCTVEDMSDEAMSIVGHRGQVPDYVSVCMNRHINCVSASLVGNSVSTGALKKIHITQFLNYYTDCWWGRCMGIYKNCNAHVFNSWAERYKGDGGVFAWEGSQVESQYNLLEPICTTNYAVDALNGNNIYQTGGGQVRGKLRDTGSWVNNTDCNQARVQNTDAELDFEIPYAYELITDELELKARINQLHG